MNERSGAPLDAADRAIILATEGGLPLVPRPYHAVADALGVTAEEVMTRMQRMRALGVIRRIAAVPKDRKSTRLNSSHMSESRMPSSA